MCSPEDAISLHQDQDDRSSGANVIFGPDTPDLQDEKLFVFQYEKEINGLLKTMTSFRTQVEELTDQYLFM